MEITIRFSVKRTGEVIGTPMITYSKLFGPPERQKAFVVSVLDALARCTPLNFAGGLGDAVVSRIISIRFVSPSDAFIRAADTFQHIRIVGADR